MRRLGIFALLAVVGCGSNPEFGATDDSTAVSSPLAATHLRIMAANTSTTNAQNYDEGPGARIFEGLKPDITLIQEFNTKGNTPADLRAFVDATFGPTFQFVRGPAAHIPNGIISRYPIVASGDWADPEVPDRDFTWARIAVPGSHPLLVVSVHLTTTTATRRAHEASLLVNFIKAEMKADDWLVLGGDFNTNSRTEPALITLSSLFNTSGPWPVDQNGRSGTSLNRKEPHDWVLVSPGLSAQAAPTIIGANSFTSGFVADTRVYSPISDLAPALASDSGGTTMQHMAVVRDFSIPTDRVPEPVDAGPGPVMTVDAGPAPTCGTLPDVVMSQVYGGGGGFTGTVFSSDYLELHNRSAVSADVSGWAVQYSQANNAAWAPFGVIPSGTVIPAGGFLLLTLNAAVGVAAAVPTPNVSISPTVSLSASSGTVALTTTATQLVGCPALSSSVVDLFGYGSATCKLGTSTPALSKVTAAARLNDGCSQHADNNADFAVVGATPRTSASPSVICACR